MFRNCGILIGCSTGVSLSVDGITCKLVPEPGFAVWHATQVSPFLLKATLRNRFWPVIGFAEVPGLSGSGMESGRVRSRFWLGFGRYAIVLMKLVKAVISARESGEPPIKLAKAALNAAKLG